jgi:hypothetical protein
MLCIRTGAKNGRKRKKRQGQERTEKETEVDDQGKEEIEARKTHQHGWRFGLISRLDE